MTHDHLNTGHLCCQVFGIQMFTVVQYSNPHCIGMIINLIFIPESRIEASNDYVNILEEGVEVHDGQLAQVLQRHVPDVVVVMKFS